MLSSRSGVFTKTISISFTFLQQGQSISFASFLQCPHFHQSRFPILICNQSAAEARICLVFFLMALIPVLIYYSNMNKTAAEAYVQFQKQPPAVFCKKSCCKKFRKFNRKIPALESLFNKVAGLQACNFIKKGLQQRHFSVKFAKFLRTYLLKNICERLLLQFVSHAWYLCWSLFLINLQVLKSATLLKRDFRTSVFLCDFRNF